MLAGLLFAIHDAEDRPGALGATLPFGGVTLIEYQARLLIGAGAAQIIVIVSRLTPELVGAIARIGRRGITVDAVRNAAEAAAKLHPLARLLMLADGLVTTDAILEPLAREGGDALLIVSDRDSPGSFERLGGGAAWAGVARLAPQRLSELAAMPQDYDVQSTLVRVAAQARAVHVSLPDGEIRDGHGIDHRADLLDRRGRSVMAAMMAGRRAWWDRWIVAPIARQLLPVMMRRAMPTAALAGAAGGAGALAIGGIAIGYPGLGILLTLVAMVLAAAGASLAWLRDEAALARGLAIVGVVLPALAAMLAARIADSIAGNRTATVLAITLIALAALAERAASEPQRQRWWGTPPALLAVIAPFALFGSSGIGLAVAASYAGITLAAAIEALRRHA